MQLVKRGEVALAFNDVGAGDAAPLLFVHGWGCNHTHFAPQQVALGTQRRTVAVDLRGHGASDAPPQEYTVAGFADDLAWQCRELELVKPIVVGHSMGGTIALELAAKHPDLLSAAVLIDSALFPSPPKLNFYRSLAEALQGAGYRSAVEQVLATQFLPSDDPALRPKVAASMEVTPQHVLSSSFADHLIKYDAAVAATACGIPIAYIGAEVPKADVPKFRQLCPHLRVGQILGAGHFATLLVPEQINTMLKGFEHAYVAG
jgi:pimeloyl-ACP methyl ester carboxylesterase